MNSVRAHRVILSAEGWIMQLDLVIAQMLTRFSLKERVWYRTAIVENLVLACTNRDTAEENIGKVAYNACFNHGLERLVRNSYVVSSNGTVEIQPHAPHPIEILTQIGYALFQQMQDLQLYDEDGRLQYTYRSISDPFFNDVALDYIQRLTWNGAFYEPPN